MSSSIMVIIYVLSSKITAKQNELQILTKYPVPHKSPVYRNRQIWIKILVAKSEEWDLMIVT